MALDNGIYVALSNQLAQFRRLDSTANNIANASTTGFTAEKNRFTTHLHNAQKEIGKTDIVAYPHDTQSYRQLEKGSFQSTGNTFDLAISGDAYFALETPGGERGYTRAGDFQIDGNGFLVNQEGLPVLSVGGQRINIPQESQDVVVNERGAILANGEEIGIVGMFEFANEQNLEHVSGTFMRTVRDEQALVSEESRMMQGVLEGSNVNAIKEMTYLIDVSKSVSSTAKFIETMYDLQRQATRTLSSAGGQG